MPELPEVEIIRQQLAPLVGKTIAGVEVLEPGSFRADAGSLIGETITEVGRKGKVLILELSPKARFFIHLKMSGRLEMLPQQYARHSRGLRPRVVMSRLRGSGVPADPPMARSGPVRKMSGQLKFFNQNILNSSTKHLRIAIGFTDGSYLLFHDQRKFGWIADDPAVLPRGVDALTPQLTPKILAGILSSSNRPVKQILLDQSKIAGIGNIYASEILWEAGISPMAKIKDEGRRTRDEGKYRSRQKSKLQVKIQKLHFAIDKILTAAIDLGGSTMNDGLYQHVGGEAGNYWPRRRVYGREGEPCRRCGTPIIRTVVSQRSTYWCPECQREIEKGFGTLDG